MYEKMGKERKPLKPGVLIHPWKGVFALSGSIFCLYTSFEALQNLESSLNNKDNIGVICLALMYGTTAVLSFGSSAAVYAFGIRGCLGFQVISHIIYIVGHFYPTPYVLFPASILLGMANSTSLSTLGVYLTAIAHSYIRMHDMALDNTHGVSSMFNGIFYCFFRGTHIVGNLLSSLVLFDSSYNMTVVDSNNCGAMVCPSNEIDYTINTTHSSMVIVPPEEHAIFTLLSVFIGFDVVGLLIIIFLTPILNMNDLNKMLSDAKSVTKVALSSPLSSLSSHADKTSSSVEGTSLSSDASETAPAKEDTSLSSHAHKTSPPKLDTSSTPRKTDENATGVSSLIKDKIREFVSILHDCRMWLLSPMWIGQAIFIMSIYTSYTEGFVSCTIGIQWVGYSMFFLGLSGALSSLFVNFFAKYTGRIPLLVLTATIDIGCFITMLLWQPDNTMSPAQSFIIPLVVGLSQGIFQPQQMVLSVSLFGEKCAACLAAVSAFKAVAFTITFFLMSTTCLYTQFSVGLAFYVIGLVGYLVTEFMEHRKTKQRELAHAQILVSSQDMTSLNEHDKKGARAISYGSVSNPD